MLFDRGQEKAAWEPPAAPDALGELLDSRHMLSLYLPSDPRLLGAFPGKRPFVDDDLLPNGRSASRASQRGAMAWSLQSSKLREVGLRTLQSIDGAVSTVRWYRPPDPEPEEEDEEAPPPPPYAPDDPNADPEELRVATHLTPLTRTRSTRRGKSSTDATPVEPETARWLRD